MTEANGSVAAASTTRTIAVSRTQAGRPSRRASTAGRPASASQPAPRAIAPAAMAGGTSGTTSRFTAGATGASRPKSSSTTGSVAAWAASETPSPSTIQPGSRPPVSRSRRLVSGVAQASSPAVASAESWKPGSSMSRGSTTRRMTTAQPSAVAALPARPLSRARSATPAISAARTTDGEPPAKAV